MTMAERSGDTVAELGGGQVGMKGGNDNSVFFCYKGIDKETL